MIFAPLVPAYAAFTAGTISGTVYEAGPVKPPSTITVYGLAVAATAVPASVPTAPIATVVLRTITAPKARPTRILIAPPSTMTRNRKGIRLTPGSQQRSYWAGENENVDASRERGPT